MPDSEGFWDVLIKDGDRRPDVDGTSLRVLTDVHLKQSATTATKWYVWVDGTGVHGHFKLEWLKQNNPNDTSYIDA